MNEQKGRKRRAAEKETSPSRGRKRMWLSKRFLVAASGTPQHPDPTQGKVLCWTHTQRRYKPVHPVSTTGSPGDFCWRHRVTKRHVHTNVLCRNVQVHAVHNMQNLCHIGKIIHFGQNCNVLQKKALCDYHDKSNLTHEKFRKIVKISDFLLETSVKIVKSNTSD